MGRLSMGDVERLLRRLYAKARDLNADAERENPFREEENRRPVSAAEIGLKFEF